MCSSATFVDALNALAAESTRSADEVKISDTISDTISDDTPQMPYLPPPLPQSGQPRAHRTSDGGGYAA